LPVKLPVRENVPFLSFICSRHPFFLLDGVKGNIDHPPKA
jgi:hypothetical protein